MSEVQSFINSRKVAMLRITVFCNVAVCNSIRYSALFTSKFRPTRRSLLAKLYCTAN